MLYVHDQNYEAVARPVLSSMIPFPMQYFVPMQQREIASQQCASVGLVAVGGNAKDIEKRYPSLGKLQEQLEENKKQGMLHLRQAKESMKVLCYAHEVFDNITLLGSGAESSVWSFTGTKALTSADLLLAAHLTVQTLESLPVPIVRKLLASEYPDLVAFSRHVSDSFQDASFNFVQPKPADVPSLYNWVLNGVSEWFYSQ